MAAVRHQEVHMPRDAKYALITGSSRGIGRGIALKLAEQGVKIAVHYYKNERAANETLAEVRRRDSDGFIVQADVLRPDEIKQMFRKVEEQFKQLDVFVSNARPEVPAFFQPPLQITLEQWDTAFDSQPKAFLVGVREAIPLMGTGGRIVALTYAEGSRTGGLQPWVGMGSAKAALESLVRYLAVTVGECDQPWLDREQCVEHAPTPGTGAHPELARARLDADGTARDAGRRRQCGGAHLFGEGGLDNRTGDLRRWRRLIDESRSPAGDTTGMT